jgi:hypothetical protein
LDRRHGSFAPSINDDVSLWIEYSERDRDKIGECRPKHFLRPSRPHTFEVKLDLPAAAAEQRPDAGRHIFGLHPQRTFYVKNPSVPGLTAR